MARKSEYNRKTHCSIARMLASKGFIDSEIAEIMGISERTMHNWKIAHPEFLQSIKEGKEDPDDKVEKSLFELATGYEYTAEKVLAVPLGNGMGSEVQTVEYKERVPPNPTAMIFWLKNRRPKQWRDKQEVELAGKDGAPIPISFTFTTGDGNTTK